MASITLGQHTKEAAGPFNYLRYLMIKQTNRIYLNFLAILILKIFDWINRLQQT